jgi:hypothetical protein
MSRRAKADKLTERRRAELKLIAALTLDATLAAEAKLAKLKARRAARGKFLKLQA